MRSFTRLLYGGLIAVALASPASAFTWSSTVAGTGIFYDLTEVGTGKTTALRFFYDPADGHSNWEICSFDNDGITTAFDATCSRYSNGQPFAGTYKAPTFVGNTTLSIRWGDARNGDFLTEDRATYASMKLPWESTAGQALSRTIIAAGVGGGPAPRNPLVSWVAPDAIYWNPDQPGSGMTFEIQHSSAMFLFFTYGTDSRAKFLVSTGAMTSASTYSGSLDECTKLPSATNATCTPVGTMTAQMSVDPMPFSRPERITVTPSFGSAFTYRRYQFD